MCVRAHQKVIESLFVAIRLINTTRRREPYLAALPPRLLEMPRSCLCLVISVISAGSTNLSESQSSPALNWPILGCLSFVINCSKVFKEGILRFNPANLTGSHRDSKKRHRTARSGGCDQAYLSLLRKLHLGPCYRLKSPQQSYSAMS
jgi:hypothetical protein